MGIDQLIKRQLGRSEFAAAIGLVGLLIMGVAIMVDVFMRWIFNAPIYGMSDLVELTTPVIVASCMPAAFAARQNITIRFFGRALDARSGQAIELFGQVVVLVILALMVWQVGLYTADIVRHDQLTWLLAVPVWPSWALTTLLLAACLPIQLLVVAETCQNLRTGHPLHDEIVEL